MMTVFLIVFSFFTIIMLMMAVGVIFGRKPIKGSCGGLGAIGVERACDCVDICKNNPNGSQTTAEIQQPKTYYP